MIVEIVGTLALCGDQWGFHEGLSGEGCLYRRWQPACQGEVPDSLWFSA